MTEVLTGESVRDQFQGFLKKHSLESCISIKLGENGGLSLNMVAESTEVADYWVRGLQKLIVNKGAYGEVVVDISLNNVVGKPMRQDREILDNSERRFPNHYLAFEKLIKEHEKLHLLFSNNLITNTLFQK